MSVTGNELGELLIDLGLITDEDLDAAVAEQHSSGDRLTVVLSKMGLVNERQLKDALELQFGVNFINLSNSPPGNDLVRMVPEDILRKYRFVPVSQQGTQFTVAMVDPDDLIAADAIRLHLQSGNFKKLVCTQDDFEYLIYLTYEKPPEPEVLEEAEALEATPDGAEPAEPPEELAPAADSAEEGDDLADPTGEKIAAVKSLFETGDDDLESLFEGDQTPQSGTSDQSATGDSEPVVIEEAVHEVTHEEPFEDPSHEKAPHDEPSHDEASHGGGSKLRQRFNALFDGDADREFGEEEEPQPEAPEPEPEPEYETALEVLEPEPANDTVSDEKSQTQSPRSRFQSLFGGDQDDDDFVDEASEPAESGSLEDNEEPEAKPSKPSFSSLFGGEDDEDEDLEKERYEATQLGEAFEDSTDLALDEVFEEVGTAPKGDLGETEEFEAEPGRGLPTEPDEELHGELDEEPVIKSTKTPSIRASLFSDDDDDMGETELNEALDEAFVGASQTETRAEPPKARASLFGDDSDDDDFMSDDEEPSASASEDSDFEDIEPAHETTPEENADSEFMPELGVAGESLLEALEAESTSSKPRSSKKLQSLFGQDDDDDMFGDDDESQAEPGESESAKAEGVAPQAEAADSQDDDFEALGSREHETYRTQDETPGDYDFESPESESESTGEQPVAKHDKRSNKSLRSMFGSPDSLDDYESPDHTQPPVEEEEDGSVSAFNIAELDAIGIKGSAVEEPTENLDEFEALNPAANADLLSEHSLDFLGELDVETPQIDSEISGQFETPEISHPDVTDLAADLVEPVTSVAPAAKAAPQEDFPEHSEEAPGAVTQEFEAPHAEPTAADNAPEVETSARKKRQSRKKAFRALFSDDESLEETEPLQPVQKAEPSKSQKSRRPYQSEEILDSGSYLSGDNIQQSFESLFSDDAALEEEVEQEGESSSPRNSSHSELVEQAYEIERMLAEAQMEEPPAAPEPAPIPQPDGAEISKTHLAELLDSMELPEEVEKEAEEETQKYDLSKSDSFEDRLVAAALGTKPSKKTSNLLQRENLQEPSTSTSELPPVKFSAENQLDMSLGGESAEPAESDFDALVEAPATTSDTEAEFFEATTRPEPIVESEFAPLPTQDDSLLNELIQESIEEAAPEVVAQDESIAFDAITPDAIPGTIADEYGEVSSEAEPTAERKSYMDELPEPWLRVAAPAAPQAEAAPLSEPVAMAEPVTSAPEPASAAEAVDEMQPSAEPVAAVTMPVELDEFAPLPQLKNIESLEEVVANVTNELVDSVEELTSNAPGYSFLEEIVESELSFAESEEWTRAEPAEEFEALGRRASPAMQTSAPASAPALTLPATRTETLIPESFGEQRPSPAPNTILAEPAAVAQVPVNTSLTAEFTVPTTAYSEPAVQEVPQPVYETAPAPVPVAPSPEPVPVQPAPEPIPVQPAPEPIPVQPAPEPVPVQPAPEPIPVQSAPEPIPVQSAPEPLSVPAPPAVSPEAATAIRGFSPVKPSPLAVPATAQPAELPVFQPGLAQPPATQPIPQPAPQPVPIPAPQPEPVPVPQPVQPAPQLEPIPVPQPIQPAPQPEPAAPPQPVQSAPAAEVDPNIMALANSILMQAVNSLCSEVHFEPMNGGLILRFMQGGELMDETTLPAELTSMLILCLKTIGGLDTSVIDKPQDKHISTSSFGNEVHLRMTSIPGEFGEMVAISLQ